MKNLVKAFGIGVVLLAVSSASAGTLWWQASSENAFDEAILYADNGTDKVELESLEVTSTNPYKTEVTGTDLAGYDNDSYLFYVEMVNYADQTVTTGYKWGYGDLVSSGYVAFDGLDANTVMAHATTQSLSDVPEPSSGLLLLIGGAMLALRRRRQK